MSQIEPYVELTSSCHDEVNFDDFVDEKRNVIIEKITIMTSASINDIIADFDKNLKNRNKKWNSMNITYFRDLDEFDKNSNFIHFETIEQSNLAKDLLLKYCSDKGYKYGGSCCNGKGHKISF